MKLAHLLAQYLYTTKKLDLPGIGTFELDSSVLIDTENEKGNKRETVDGIHFTSNTGLKETPDLISFISTETGKIKALAAADLDSHLSLGIQFLNIGKPFLLEGIGSLIKNQDGSFGFTAGALTPEVMKEHPAKQFISTELQHESLPDYKDILRPKKIRAEWKKPVAILLLLGSVAFAIWGGYTIYKTNTSTDTIATTNEEPVVNIETAPADTNVTAKLDTTTQTDSVVTNTIAEPTPPTATIATTAAGTYKFIVETAGRSRAFVRYERLKNLPTPIEMETSDSVTFKLFYRIAAAPSDTAHIMDSLRISYTPRWSKGYIE